MVILLLSVCEFLSATGGRRTHKKSKDGGKINKGATVDVEGDAN